MTSTPEQRLFLLKMAFPTKTRPGRLILILLISSLSYQSTNSQNLDTASPIPKILENNDLGRIDVGIDEEQGKYSFYLYYSLVIN